MTLKSAAGATDTTFWTQPTINPHVIPGKLQYVFVSQIKQFRLLNWCIFYANIFALLYAFEIQIENSCPWQILQLPQSKTYIKCLQIVRLGFTSDPKREKKSTCKNDVQRTATNTFWEKCVTKIPHHIWKESTPLLV